MILIFFCNINVLHVLLVKEIKMRAYPAVFKTKYEGDLWKKCFIFHFRDEKIGDMK